MRSIVTGNCNEPGHPENRGESSFGTNRFSSFRKDGPVPSVNGTYASHKASTASGAKVVRFLNIDSMNGDVPSAKFRHLGAKGGSSCLQGQWNVSPVLPHNYKVIL